jgi:DNA-binding MarR family transcriptional regulator
MTSSQENSRRADKTPLGTMLSILTSFEVLSRYLEVSLRRHDATLIRFNIMTTLFKNGGEMTPSEIAGTVFRGKNTITAALKTLESEGVVRRVPSTDDRRSVKVVITDKGWNVANHLSPIVQELSRDALGCLDKAREEELVTIMRDIREDLLPRLAGPAGNGRRQAVLPE